MEIVQDALRIHGGHGYINDYAIERLYREAPLYVVGEGTNEIQKLLIARRLQWSPRGGIKKGVMLAFWKESCYRSL